jgi:hypothetical protein
LGKPALNEFCVHQFVREHAFDFGIGQSSEQIVTDAQSGASCAAAITFQPHPGVGGHFQSDGLRHADVNPLAELLQNLKKAGSIFGFERDSIFGAFSQPQAPKEYGEEGQMFADYRAHDCGRAESRQNERQYQFECQQYAENRDGQEDEQIVNQNDSRCSEREEHFRCSCQRLFCLVLVCGPAHSGDLIMFNGRRP